MIIAMAIDGNAKIIVTGDIHLVKLKIFREIKITTVEKMMAYLKGKETI